MNTWKLSGTEDIFKTQDLVILTHQEKIMGLYSEAVIVRVERGFANKNSIVNALCHMSFKEGSLNVTLQGSEKCWS